MNELFLGGPKRGNVRSTVEVKGMALLGKFLVVAGHEDVTKVFRLVTVGAEARVKGVPEDPLPSSDDPVPDESYAGGT